MAQISIRNLSFAYPDGSEPVFENISFTLDTDWKLGLIGRNGRGKTTLLSLLMNQYEYSGSITSPEDFDYFPQTVSDPDLPVIELIHELVFDIQDWQISRELSLLEFSPDLLWQPFSLLSGGEKTKVLLAALFLNDRSFKLIDEPTNHLDVLGRKKVSEYLQKKKGFILVSHDRDVLDRCTDHILSINRSGIDLHKGNYSVWKNDFLNRQKFEAGQNEKLKRQIRSLEQAARTAAAWSDRIEASKKGAFDKGYVGHKSAKMMKRSISAQNRKNRALEEKKSLLQDQEETEKLKIHPLKHFSRRLVTVENVSVIYDNRQINQSISFDISQSERLFLEGANGSGKSSLLHLIEGADISHTGTVHTASGLILSIVNQETGFLQGSLSDLISQRHLDESLFKAILRKMGFERELFDRSIESYSAGQKKKVLLAASLSEQAHLYIWDEPLNYLDIDCREQIEALIQEYQPTMLLVEHDQRFRDTIATQVIHLNTDSDNGKVV